MSVTVAADRSAAVQSWGTAVSSALSGLPQELESAAPTGEFPEVLARATAALQAGPFAARAPSAGAGRVSPSPVSAPRAGSATVASSLQTTGVSGAAIVREAEKYVGVPYVWGGETPASGFDCSGLVQYVFSRFGIELPRTTYTQVKIGTPVTSLTQASAGDLVFFAGSDGTPTSPGHVGIYIGNGMMVDAPHSGTDVQVQPVSSAGQVVAIRDVLGSGAPSPAPPTIQGATRVQSTQWPTPAQLAAQVPSSLAPLFVSAAGTYGVPVSLLTAIAYHESRFETNAVSTAGAEGLMQIMPTTARRLGVTPFTARQAIAGAAELLSGYLRQYGSVQPALAAYNAGPAAVARYGGVPPYAQTQTFVSAVLQMTGGSQ